MKIIEVLFKHFLIFVINFLEFFLMTKIYSNISFSKIKLFYSERTLNSYKLHINFFAFKGEKGILTHEKNDLTTNS